MTLKYWLLMTAYCAIVGSCNAQARVPDGNYTSVNNSTIVIHHHSYTTYYSPSKNEPDSVSWVLTPAMVSCDKHIPRTNKFVADPKIPGTDFNKYYAKSGYDKGHQMSADDNSCDPVGEIECWYFSNMLPQVPNLNRKVWKSLEADCRRRAKTETLHISCGGYGSLGKIGCVNIPAYCWKKVNGVLYVMPNVDSVSKNSFSYYRK